MYVHRHGQRNECNACKVVKMFCPEYFRWNAYFSDSEYHELLKGSSILIIHCPDPELETGLK